MSWDRPRKENFPPAVRKVILHRDRICAHCGEAPSTQADHIKPVSEGGDHSPSNGQGLCDPCHDRKTRAEAKRGYKRWNDRDRPRQQRKPEKHPGILG